MGLTRLNKIAILMILATAQVAADKEAVDLSRVQKYKSKLVYPALTR